MQTTVRLTGMLRSDEFSPAFRRRLLDAFRGWRRVGRRDPPAAS
jgi:hypothetical protein